MTFRPLVWELSPFKHKHITLLYTCMVTVHNVCTMYGVIIRIVSLLLIQQIRGCMYCPPPPLMCVTHLTTCFFFLRSLCVHPLPPRQRRRLRRRRNQRSVPQPQRDPRIRSQPSCSPTRTCLLHTLLLYVFQYHK